MVIRVIVANPNKLERLLKIMKEKRKGVKMFLCPRLTRR